MKLFCLSGESKGDEYPVNPPGVCIGREQDNDIVIPASDQEVSRYHAKIELRDRTWTLLDLKSSNGVYVNGEKVSDTQSLSPGDELRIGQSLFKFIGKPEVELRDFPIPEPPSPADTEPAIETIPPEPDEKNEPEPAQEPDLKMEDLDTITFTPEPTNKAKTKKKKSLIPLLLTLLILFCILFGAAVFLKQLDEKSRQNAKATAVELSPENLVVFYENLKVDNNTVFRYELRVLDGHIILHVDDLKNKRRFEENEELTKAQLDYLNELVMDQAFLALEPVTEERRSDRLYRSRLLIQNGPKGNYIEVTNALIPEPLSIVAGNLTAFVQDQFGIMAEAIPRDEAIQMAHESYLNARRLYTEKIVDPANLYRSIKIYKQVLQRLKFFDEKPEWYDLAYRAMEKAEKELNETLEKYMRDAIALRSAGNYLQARETFDRIIKMVPDRDHQVASRARIEILKLNSLINSKRKNR